MTDPQPAPSHDSRAHVMDGLRAWRTVQLAVESGSHPTRLASGPDRAWPAPDSVYGPGQPARI